MISAALTHDLPETLLVVDDDDLVRAGIVATLERDGRVVIGCADREAAEVLLEHVAVSAVIADVRLASAFNFDGLAIVDHARRKRNAPVVLVTGDATPELEFEARRRGAAGVLQKPAPSLAIERILGLRTDLQCASSEMAVEVPSLADILRSRGISTKFLPIVSTGAGRREIFGYEALSRCATGSPVDNPEILFSYAERKQRLVELETHCIANSLREGAAFTAYAKLFINVHPVVLSTDRTFASTVIAAADAAGARRDAIVLELTEQGALGDESVWKWNVEHLREAGIEFAFDDFGVAYSHLLEIDTIRPAFLKLSTPFGQTLATDATLQKILRITQTLARECSSRLIVEGVEDERSIEAACALGVDLVQGFAFGMPRSAAELLTA